MLQIARSFRVLLIAVFVAVTMVAAGVSMKAEASMAMGPMAMATVPDGTQAQDCAKCASQMTINAGCNLTCGLSMIAALPDLDTPAFATTACRFDPADTAATGLAPSPAFTPPRTTSLI